MIPADLELPAKFREFYPEQLDTAIAIAASDKRFFLDAAPTGFGKSLMYMAVAQLLGPQSRAVVLTANKGLQQQLSGDFAPIGLVDVRGQANYPCQALMARKKGFQGCDIGPCHHGVACELHPRYGNKPGCDWFDALKRAHDSRLVVTNYDFWMSVNRYMDQVIGQFDLLILDEAHDAPDKLAEFCTVKLLEEDCEEFLEDGLPPVEDGADAWADWADGHEETLAEALDASKGWATSDPETAKRLRDFAGNVGFLATARAWQRGEPSEPTVQIPGLINDWVAERFAGKRGGGKGATFSPVWAHRYSERFLFNQVPKVVLVSATIMPVTAHYLGIPADNMEFRDHQSGFAPKRRPVYLYPRARISSKSSDLDYRAMIVAIDQIIRSREGMNGIIHTVSYRLSDIITSNSSYRARMDFCKTGRYGNREPARDVVDRFKKRGGILVGPSFDTGFDFPYAECDYQIVAKLPFIDSRPKVIEARKKSDKLYLNYVTTLRLIQMCGRGMRAADDTCDTFVIDDNIRWFYPAVRTMLPAWYRAAIHWVDGVPAPQISRAR